MRSPMKAMASRNEDHQSRYERVAESTRKSPGECGLYIHLASDLHCVYVDALFPTEECKHTIHCSNKVFVSDLRNRWDGAAQ
jgi:hypothetical protein